MATTGYGRFTKAFSKDFLFRHFEEPVFVMGSTSLTRYDLAVNMGITHTASARWLEKLFKRMHVSSVRGILRVPMLDWARVNGLGEAKLLIMLELLAQAGVSDDAVQQWMTSALSGHKLVQWSTICTHAARKGRKSGHAA